jgi:hypothetical protein
LSERKGPHSDITDIKNFRNATALFIQWLLHASRR